MAGKHVREPRKPVKIGARLKSERGWSDIVIRNVSSRGMMGICPAPPERGDYVEVRCGTYVIVARVAWKGEGSFGAQSQARIDLDDLLTGSVGRSTACDRRKLPRAAEPASRRPAAETAQAHARVGRLFDFVSVVLAAVVFAALVAGQAYAVLAEPLDAAARALVPAERS